MGRRRREEAESDGPALTVAVWYIIASAVAFAMYGIDKRRAERRQWRISEGALHAAELLGGWPGALIAQRVWRHKRQKGRYMLVFWAIVGIHACAWVWWSGIWR